MLTSIVSKVWLAMVALVLVILLLAGGLIGSFIERFYYLQRAAEMQREGEILAKIIAEDQAADALTGYMDAIAQHTRSVIWLVDREGTVWKTSGPARLRRGAKLDRADLGQVLQGKPLVRRGSNPRLDKPALSVGIPVIRTGEVAGAVLIHTPLNSLDAFIDRVYRLIAVAAVGGILLATIVAFFLARGLTKPLLEINRAAKELAQGNFTAQAPVYGRDEVGRLAQTFNNMAAALGRSLKVQKDFVANVSHELRTPLSIIKGYAEAILDGVVTQPKELRKHLRIIIDETERLGRLTEELLTLAKLEAGMGEIQPGPVDLAALITRVTDKFTPLTTQQGITLQTSVPADLPPVNGVADHLEQVFTNLLANALQHTPQGGKIGITAKAGSRDIVICLTDTGQGIPAAHLPFIWERFYKVDQARNRKSGSGLGLAIVKHIVSSHGGTVAVESKEGAGTTFILTLPRAG